jgi:benzoyl-CoA reductase/2-hydroxyglutaryl-CoA dehydratase subunit BcrC/BadD/HgdB
MRVGLTTTIPVEPIFASYNIPVDLNNIFITKDDPEKLVEFAEIDGFPYNTCSWIKGLYTVSIMNDIDIIIGVVRGDCSNTESLLDFLTFRGKMVYPFSYPFDKSRKKLELEINSLMEYLNADRNELEKIIKKVEEARKLAWDIDYYTIKNKITGYENHIFLVSSSDFFGDIEKYVKLSQELLEKSKERDEIDHVLRIGYVGVPPIFTDIYQFLESKKVHVVFNEVQRQFSMPFPEEDWIGKYLKYTYPYTIFDRINDIKIEIKRRNIDGIIHYVQSFCHRQIIDEILKEMLDVKVLTIEGNRPGKLDERTKLRIESFIDMLL